VEQKKPNRHSLDSFVVQAESENHVWLEKSDNNASYQAFHL